MRSFVDRIALLFECIELCLASESFCSGISDVTGDWSRIKDGGEVKSAFVTRGVKEKEKA